jgi:hypothetical protein
LLAAVGTTVVPADAAAGTAVAPAVSAAASGAGARFLKKVARVCTDFFAAVARRSRYQYYGISDTKFSM